MGSHECLASVDLHGLSGHDWRQITQWNATPASIVDACVHDLVSRRARLQPHSEAIIAWDGRLTYLELDDLSGRLALYLSNRGIGPELIVPVVFEKSIWAIVAFLGVLKAGGAYLAVDPEQPAARRHVILKDSAAKIVLGSPKSNKALRAHTGIEIVTVDAHFLQTLPQTDEPVLHTPSPHNAAFILYTVRHSHGAARV